MSKATDLSPPFVVLHLVVDRPVHHVVAYQAVHHGVLAGSVVAAGAALDAPLQVAAQEVPRNHLREAQGRAGQGSTERQGNLRTTLAKIENYELVEHARGVHHCMPVGQKRKWNPVHMRGIDPMFRKERASGRIALVQRGHGRTAPVSTYLSACISLHRLPL